MFFGENENADHYLGAGFFEHKGITAVKRVDFVSDRIS
jgi:hypothetical protein